MKYGDPLISIIVPVYNCEKFLEKNLSSIINQTYQKIEIIVVDDGSTDKSSKIISNFIKKDDRIICIYQNNQGQAVARNIGLKKASGDYIMFIDSDDFLMRDDAIEIIANKLKDENSDLLIFGYELFFSKRKPIIKKAVTEIDKMYIGSWNKVYKADLVSNLQFTVGKYYEDTVFVLMSRLRSKKISIVDSCLYAYVQHSGSITAINSDYKRHLDIVHVLKPVISSSSFLNSSSDMQEKTKIAINYQLITHIIVLLDHLKVNKNELQQLLNEFYEFENMLFPNKNFKFSRNFFANKIWNMINTIIKKNPYSITSRLVVKMINDVRSIWRE